MPRKTITWICRKKRTWNLSIIFSCKCTCSSFLGEFSHLWVYWKPVQTMSKQGLPLKKNNTQQHSTCQGKDCSVSSWNAAEQTISHCAPGCMGSSGTGYILFLPFTSNLLWKLLPKLCSQRVRTWDSVVFPDSQHSSSSIKHFLMWP